MKYTTVLILVILLQLRMPSYSQKKITNCKKDALAQRAWQYYDSLGNAAMLLGDTSVAISYYQRSVDLNKEKKPALDQLRRHYVHAGCSFFLTEY